MQRRWASSLRLRLAALHQHLTCGLLMPYRMLPGLNAAAVGLITAAVFQLSFSVRSNSPFPVASTCIGAASKDLQSHGHVSGCQCRCLY